MVTAKTRLCQIDEAIDAAMETQAGSKSTIGKTKVALKKAIASKADILNDLIEAYASIEGDDELARQMGDSEWQLFRLSYDELLLRVKAIIAKAEELKETLVTDYGMTEEQVTDLQNDVDRLLEISGQPRAYSVKRSVATQEIAQLLSEANEVLTIQLDKLASVFKNRDANFYNGYVKARLIVGD